MGKERRVKTKHLGQQCCVKDYAFVATSVYGIKKEKKERKKEKQTNKQIIHVKVHYKTAPSLVPVSRPF